MVLLKARKQGLCAPFIVSMSPPNYPSAWLLPSRASFRFARQDHCSSAAIPGFLNFRFARDSGAIPRGLGKADVAGSLRRVPNASHDFGAHPIQSLAPYLSPLHCAESETLDGSPSPFFKSPSMNARTRRGLHRSFQGYPPEQSGFPRQSPRFDWARPGKTRVVGPLVSHLVLR
jgi:hypothetical protein